MIDMTKQYKTRDGRDVRVLCVDANHPDYPVVALTEEGFPERYTANGRCYADVPEQSQYDLVEVKPERWVNIYGDGASWIYDTKELADGYADKRNRLACLRFREGDGL